MSDNSHLMRTMAILANCCSFDDIENIVAYCGFDCGNHTLDPPSCSLITRRGLLAYKKCDFKKPERKKSHGVKSHDLADQFLFAFHEIPQTRHFPKKNYENFPKKKSKKKVQRTLRTVSAKLYQSL